MRAINCLIVDDEPLAHRVIENFARDLRFLKIVRKCRNAMEAREALHEEERIDLIFLDIQMPKLTGLAFLRSLSHPPLVIFTTAYDNHALESYELEAVDYLKKPFSFERFSRALEKVQRRLATEQSASSERIGAPASEAEPSSSWRARAEGHALPPAVSHVFVKSEGATVRVDVADIALIESMGDYVKLVGRDRSITCHDSLQTWQDRLPENQFLRVHKSFVVAVAKIDSIEGAEITIAGRRVPIGRTYRKSLIERIGGA